MKDKGEKTNALRKLDSMKIKYEARTYEDAVNGEEVAALLGQSPDRVFKTLVTVGKSGEHYVFVVPVNRELDLKKAAATVGEKSIEMVKSKELLGLTGYIHGGCSPIGMKKFFRTTIDESAQRHDTFFCSGGRIGLQIELSCAELARVIRYELADLVK